MHAGTSWLTLFAAIFLGRWLAAEAVTEQALRRRNLLIFRAPIGLRLLFGFCVPGMVYAAGAVAYSENSRNQWWLSAMFLGFAAWIAYFWPADIGVSKSGIYEQEWLGLWKKTIQWDDVTYATADGPENSVIVVSKSGYRIRHTKYHVDRMDFLHQLTIHGKLLKPGRGLY